ncbi:hypothetical protein BH10PSE3_BH10PSE3_35630 [soil metagenome]
MQKWIYQVGGLAALAIALSSGYFVGQHLLWVHTFGWPILSTAGLVTFSAACIFGLVRTALMIRKLVIGQSAKGN